MTIKTKLILAAALAALLSAPASARIEGDEGGSTAYPLRHPDRMQMTHGHMAPGHFVNRPQHWR